MSDEDVTASKSGQKFDPETSRLYTKPELDAINEQVRLLLLLRLLTTVLAGLCCSEHGRLRLFSPGLRCSRKCFAASGRGPAEAAR